MILPYLGSVKTIAFVPVAALAGISAASVRLFSVTIGALALWATYLFGRRLFVRPDAAAIATVLLATDPSFLLYSRVDFSPTAFMLLFKGLALWLLLDWWRSGRRRSLVLGCLSLGLGVYDKADFVWIIAGVAVAAFALDRRRVARRLLRRGMLAGAAAFLIGCLPLVVYNLSWPPRTLGASLEGKLHLRYGNGSGNPAIELWERIRLLGRLLDGERVSRDLGGIAYGWPALPLAALTAFVAVSLLYTRKELRPRIRPGFFMVLCTVFTLAATALTPGGGGPQHVLLVYPFPHLLLAGALAELASLGSARRSATARVTVGILVVSLVAAGIWSNQRTMSRLHRTGGTANFSSAIYDLNDYLLAHDRNRRIVAVDWGIHHNLVGLSQGRLSSLDLWLPLNEPGTPRGTLRADLTRPDYRYVLHSRAETNFQLPRLRFFEFVKEAGKRPQLETAIFTKGGERLFEVYKVVQP
jgi:4-amino-4-deoxy-L-arabinose transferase-like glycosyltransferase